VSTTPVPVVWSPATRDHDPSGEIWIGVPTPGGEDAERVDAILAATDNTAHQLIEATAHADDALLAVHSPGLLAHLRTVHDEWLAGDYVEQVGQDRVVPYFFPTATMLDGLPMHTAAAVHGRAGQFCYDTMTVVGPGTWSAARAAVDCALTAVDLVLDGAPLAYALCRPPGHHVTRQGYGGSCYLNNAAVAAQALRAAGRERVAVLDIDAHHGNGTAAIFYDRGDVSYGSVHVDPGAGWFPHVVGHADETGVGEGAGATRNVPLTPGGSDPEWLAAVAELRDWTHEAAVDALVVSLGVDAAADDPESPLLVTPDGYRDAGRLLGGLGVPTVAVQEGGYHLPSLGGLVVACLEGLGVGFGHAARR